MVKKLRICEDYKEDKVYKRVIYTINELDTLISDINNNKIRELDNTIKQFRYASEAAKDIIKFDAGWANKEYIDSFIYDVQIILDKYKAILDNINELNNDISRQDLMKRADHLIEFHRI